MFQLHFLHCIHIPTFLALFWLIAKSCCFRYHVEHDILSTHFLSKANPGGAEPIPGKSGKQQYLIPRGLAKSETPRKYPGMDVHLFGVYSKYILYFPFFKLMLSFISIPYSVQSIVSCSIFCFCAKFPPVLFQISYLRVLTREKPRLRSNLFLPQWHLPSPNPLYYPLRPTYNQRCVWGGLQRERDTSLRAWKDVPPAHREHKRVLDVLFLDWRAWYEGYWSWWGALVSILWCWFSCLRVFARINMQHSYPQTDTQEYPTSLLAITVAQRYSVLVTARNDTSSNYVVHANLEWVLSS